MFKNLITSINGKDVFMLNEDKANMLFLKTFIKFLDDCDIATEITTYDFYLEEEFEEFKFLTLYNLSNDNFLSHTEKETLDIFIKKLFYVYRDDLMTIIPEMNLIKNKVN